MNLSLSTLRKTPLWAIIPIVFGVLLISLPDHTGKILVASPDISSDPFAQEVILILDQGYIGSRGIILSEPMELKDKALADMYPGADTFYGGPVGYGNRQYGLMHDEKGRVWVFSNDGQPVSPHTDNSYNDDLQLSEKRVYFGRVGWAPLQLTFEIERGEWDLLPYNKEIALNTDPEKMWHKARGILVLNKKQE